MVDTVLGDPDVQKYVSAAGFQWAGKLSLQYTQEHYPDLKLFASEQECGDGKNNWPACLHAWSLMKYYFRYGVSVYDYWNISLEENVPSRWGWRQNSLVTVNAADSSYKFTYEYYLLKHASSFVKPGAKYLPVSGSYDDMMAFKNPDGSVVLILHNPGPEDPEKDMYDFTAFSAKADSSGLSNPLGKNGAVEEAQPAADFFDLSAVGLFFVFSELCFYLAGGPFFAH